MIKNLIILSMCDELLVIFEIFIIKRKYFVSGILPRARFWYQTRKIETVRFYMRWNIEIFVALTNLKTQFGGIGNFYQLCYGAKIANVTNQSGVDTNGGGGAFSISFHRHVQRYFINFAVNVSVAAYKLKFSW